MFGSLIRKLGEPADARKPPTEEIARYAGWLPEALLAFWAEHGRGSYQDGAFWICDPQPFVPVLKEIFDGDAEFDPHRMSVIAYGAFGTLMIWDTLKKQISVHLLLSQVSNVPEKSRINPSTGQPFSDDSMIAAFIAGMQYSDSPLFTAALRRLGRLDDEGEIYGFVPALQLGGSFDVDHLHRIRVVEHVGFIAQLQRMTLTRLTRPDPPRLPYGRIEAIRTLGRVL